ncbi:MAG: ABC transporter ATP-binding protein [Bacteroidaceae bacterium]|nr:ABC transporter ATP-binding protein [Bacteroidaceae bacterium]
MKTAPVISAQHLDIGYRTGGDGIKRVHSDLNIALYAGELTCLLGANGAGKSTLLRTLSGAQPSLSGDVCINGKPLKEISQHNLSQTIGVVLTDKTAIGGLTVREVVALGRQPHTGFFGILSSHDKQVVEESLEACGIADKGARYMASLSDGERQKVMIAKALAQECPIVLLDEPTAFLDIVSRIEVMSLLHRIATEHHRAILLSTHDIEQALVLSDRLWLLSREKGLTSGVTEDLILSGCLNDLFPHSDIHFDPLHGSYYPTVHRHKSATVVCHDETLLHWAINLLNRNGYGASFDTTTQCPIVIHIDSRTRILWQEGENSVVLQSFEELVRKIQEKR